MTASAADKNVRPDWPTVQDYLDRDPNEVPAALRYNRNDQDDLTDIPLEQYISPEFARLEMEKLWYRVWQMACFEYEVAKPGDHVVYDIGDRSYIIMRGEDGVLRALVNVCLHRARRLRDFDGNVPELRCTYHGWTWNNDGSLKNLPCRWDFPQLEGADLSLPEGKVEVWRGIVFLSPDPDAEPLSDFLEGFDEVFIWPIEDRVKVAHTRKVIPLNWKAAQEAFMESYHVGATHPQIATFNSDFNAQYDATSDRPHWNRMINMNGVASPDVADFVDEQDIVNDYIMARDAYSAVEGRDITSDAGIPQVPEGGTARATIAAAIREQLHAFSGKDYSSYSESELIDTLQHTIFPNFHPWGGMKSNACYRWRPNGFDPDSCIFETFILSEVPDGQERKPIPIHDIPEDQKFCEVPELGLLGPVYDQDLDNMVTVQRGMKATMKKGIPLARYHESRIRHMHQTLLKWMEK